jgi:hypothetical protein
MFSDVTFGQVKPIHSTPDTYRAADWNAYDQRVLNTLGRADKGRDLAIAALLMGDYSIQQAGHGNEYEWNLPLADGRQLSLQFTSYAHKNTSWVQDFRLEIGPRVGSAQSLPIIKGERSLLPSGAVDYENASLDSLNHGSMPEQLAAIHQELWRSPQLVAKAQALKAQLS